MSEIAAAIEVEELLEDLSARTPKNTNFVWALEDCPMPIIGIVADLCSDRFVTRFPFISVFCATHGGVHLKSIDDGDDTVRLQVGRWMISAW